jgi:putative ABC transport system permease protein
MLTVLLGAGKGLENGVNEGFPKVTNAVYIWLQAPTQIPFQGMPIGRWVILKPEDVDAIAKNVASVGFIKGQNSVGVWDGSPPYTVRKSKNGAFSIEGGFAGIENFNALRIVAGRPFNPMDEQQHRKVVMIGQRVRDQLFAKD